MLKQKKIISIFIISLFLPFSFVYAGTILSPHLYAWSNNDGYINFEHVIVNDNALSGYAWSTNKGFIIFNPSQSGVLNDGTGNLSGSAWGEQLGYIDFNNVSINASGKFSGTATGDLVGTINFDCPNFCDVETDWRPASALPPVSSPSVVGGIVVGSNGPPVANTITSSNSINTTVPSLPSTGAIVPTITVTRTSVPSIPNTGGGPIALAQPSTVQSPSNAPTIENSGSPAALSQKSATSQAISDAVKLISENNTSFAFSAIIAEVLIALFAIFVVWLIRMYRSA